MRVALVFDGGDGPGVDVEAAAALGVQLLPQSSPGDVLRGCRARS